MFTLYNKYCIIQYLYGYIYMYTLFILLQYYTVLYYTVQYNILYVYSIILYCGSFTSI